MKNKITTKNLTLDRLSECDYPSLISLFCNETVKKTYMLPDLDTQDKQRNMFDRLKPISEKDDRYLYVIFLGKSLIGIINDTEIRNSSIEIGYAIHPDYHNQGYATEAFSALISHLFDIGFKSVIAGAFDDNIASIRVMEKCGLKRISRTETVEYRGKSNNCVFYEISK